MRPRDLLRGPRGAMGEGAGGSQPRTPRGSRGHLGDPLGPSGWFDMCSDD